jgi:hypothetical protein
VLALPARTERWASRVVGIIQEDLSDSHPASAQDREKADTPRGLIRFRLAEDRGAVTDGEFECIGQLELTHIEP